MADEIPTDEEVTAARERIAADQAIIQRAEAAARDKAKQSLIDTVDAPEFSQLFDRLAGALVVDPGNMEMMHMMEMMRRLRMARQAV